jgi:hypothetical protein
VLIIRQQAARTRAIAKRAVNEAGGQLQAFDIGSLVISLLVPSVRFSGSTSNQERP